MLLNDVRCTLRYYGLVEGMRVYGNRVSAGHFGISFLHSIIFCRSCLKETVLAHLRCGDVTFENDGTGRSCCKTIHEQIYGP